MEGFQRMFDQHSKWRARAARFAGMWEPRNAVPPVLLQPQTMKTRALRRSVTTKNHRNHRPMAPPPKPTIPWSQKLHRPFANTRRRSANAAKIAGTKKPPLSAPLFRSVPTTTQRRTGVSSDPIDIGSSSDEEDSYHDKEQRGRRGTNAFASAPTNSNTLDVSRNSKAQLDLANRDKQRLQEQISVLQQQLATANREKEKLQCENNNLQKKYDETESKNQKLQAKYNEAEQHIFKAQRVFNEAAGKLQAHDA